MSLERLKTNLLAKARDYGILTWFDVYAKSDRYGHMSPANIARNKRVRAALIELMAEGKLDGDLTDPAACMRWTPVD